MCVSASAWTAVLDCVWLPFLPSCLVAALTSWIHQQDWCFILKWFFHSFKNAVIRCWVEFYQNIKFVLFCRLFFSFYFVVRWWDRFLFLFHRNTLMYRNENPSFLFCLSVGGGVSVVRKGGGGASGVRQSGPAADRRPMPRYFGTSRQCSGRQLLTHTHTLKNTYMLATSNCLTLKPTENFTFTHLKAGWNYSFASTRPNWECFWCLLISLTRIFQRRSLYHLWHLVRPSRQSAVGFAIMTSCILWREKILPNCIKRGWEGAEVATLLLMPDLHTVTTLFDPFRHNFAFVSAAFDSLHHFAAIFPFLFVSYVTIPAFSSKLGLHVQRLGRKTVSLAFLPLRKCRCFCDNPFSFSFVETSLFLYFYPGGRGYKIIALYF